MSFIFNNYDLSLNSDSKVRFYCMTRSLMVYGLGLMMLLSTGGSLLMEIETESPVKEKQGEKEGESEEVFVRHSKHSKLHKFHHCSTMEKIIAAPLQCCYQYISFIRGHQLENGLVAHLLC